MPAQDFDVVDKIGSGVLQQAAERSGAPGTALVEDHHSPELGVEEAPVHRAGARTRAAVEEQDRLAAWVADLLPIHDVAPRKRQVAGFERSDLGKQVAARHGPMLMQSPRATEQSASRSSQPIAGVPLAAGPGHRYPERRRVC